MRESGVLLPVTSLPSKYGIGCFDAQAYAFVDALAAAGQTYWQILPLGPTGLGDSPYQSFSTFAGNPYFISLDALAERGWLTTTDIEGAGLSCPARRVDYALQYTARYPLLRKACANSGIETDPAFAEYCENQAHWIEDYALFMALKNEHSEASWLDWEEPVRRRVPEALAEARIRLAEETRFWKFLQFEFSRQWNALRRYANASGIRIVGDIPIYVAPDSADIWANPELFQLDSGLRFAAVAGCPPDGFSATGQMWGNPLYDWPRHKETGYAWWLRRLEHCFSICDAVRIDHFRGFDEYYAIPAGRTDGIVGAWEKGPGTDLFRAVDAAFPGKEIIAEDLGYMTDTVKALLAESGYPGMKVLEFAFDSRDTGCADDYKPHNYVENCVVYTGTHDNETVVGWFAEGLLPEERTAARDYLCDHSTPDAAIHIPMICMAMRSVGRICITPMQDLLGYGNEARTNTPSTSEGNWQWRLLPGEFGEGEIAALRAITERYGRLRSR